jgi:beta-galactosidase
MDGPVRSSPTTASNSQFEARESYVEFTPDLLDNLTLEVQGRNLLGRYFLQEY